MTLTLGTKQSFTPAHTPVCPGYTPFPAQFGGVGAGVEGWFGIRRETLTVHVSTPAHPGVRRLREGGREQVPRRAQAESWAPPEPPPSPYPGHRQGLWEQGCQSRRARWWPDLAQQQERQMPAEAPQFLEEAPQFGPLTWVPRG